MKNKFLLTISTIFILTFFLITFYVLRNQTTGLDNFVFSLVPHNKILTSIMNLITTLGSTAGLSLIAILLFILIRDKRKSIFFPVNLALIGGINYFLKFLIQRERPINSLIEVTGYSFPSGHSSSSLAFYGFLIYYVYQNCKNPKLKTILISFLSILILTIGVSRIYLRAHYFTDVIGAFTYSLAYLIIFIFIFKSYCNTQNKVL